MMIEKRAIGYRIGNERPKVRVINRTAFKEAVFVWKRYSGPA
jgi:hypothetical protein